MSEVLSQAEVENLLNRMEEGPAAPAAQPTPPPPAPKPVAERPPRVREKVTPYDFKRPERVGKEQMRALQTMHEGFGRNFGAALSALLRSIVEVKLTSVDQLTYSEFIFSLENPTCFNLINAKPLEGQLIVDINPSLLFPIIDRLLGGGSTATESARRPLTEIELLLVGRITGLFLKEMRLAWENVIELELAVERVESNPQLVQIVPPNEVVVLISFELTLGEIRGMINLCIPFNAIERIGGKLSANSWATYSAKAPSPETLEGLNRRVQRAAVEMVVELADTTISTADFISLRVGDIITTEKDIRQPLSIMVEGRKKFHASAGAFKGRKAVQVSEAVEQPNPAAAAPNPQDPPD